MITRKEYLSSYSNFQRKEQYDLHVSFYSQFIVHSTELYAVTIAEKISSQFDKIGSALNEYRNLVYWDRCATSIGVPLAIYNQAYEKTDTSVWTSDKLCVLKIAVRSALIAKGFVEVWEMSRYGYLEAFLVKGAI